MIGLEGLKAAVRMGGVKESAAGDVALKQVLQRHASAASSSGAQVQYCCGIVYSALPICLCRLPPWGQQNLKGGKLLGLQQFLRREIEKFVEVVSVLEISPRVEMKGLSGKPPMHQNG